MPRRRRSCGISQRRGSSIWRQQGVSHTLFSLVYVRMAMALRQYYGAALRRRPRRRLDNTVAPPCGISAAAALVTARKSWAICCVPLPPYCTCGICLQPSFLRPYRQGASPKENQDEQERESPKYFEGMLSGALLEQRVQ